jgi:hypothetical protein
MAEATGGRVFFPPSVEEMSNSFKEIEEELRSQYALTYTPADFNMDGAFRTIYLYCNDRRYQVRTRNRATSLRASRNNGRTNRTPKQSRALFPILKFRSSFPVSGCPIPF